MKRAIVQFDTPLLQSRATLLSEFENTVQEIQAAIKGNTTLTSWGPDARRHLSRLGQELGTKPDPNFLTRSDARAIIFAMPTNLYSNQSGIVPKLLLIENSLKKLQKSSFCISDDINEFRFLVERIAVLLDIRRKLAPKLTTFKVRSISDYTMTSEIVRNISSGTRFHWRSDIEVPFEDMEGTGYQFDQELDIQDLTAKSILGAIDRSSKVEVKGLRAFYNFCCEFVHPNLGDTLSTGVNLKIRRSSYADVLRVRKLSAVYVPSDQDDHEVRNLDLVRFLHCYQFVTRLVSLLPDLLKDLGVLLKTSKAFNKRTVHKAMSVQSIDFNKDELCPCASGFTVRRCRQTLQ